MRKIFGNIEPVKADRSLECLTSSTKALVDPLGDGSPHLNREGFLFHKVLQNLLSLLVNRVQFKSKCLVIRTREIQALIHGYQLGLREAERHLYSALPMGLNLLFMSIDGGRLILTKQKGDNLLFRKPPLVLWLVLCTRYAKILIPKEKSRYVQDIFNLTLSK